MNIFRAPSKCTGGPDLPKVPSAELDEQFAADVEKEQKPFVAQGPGQALGEVFNLTANAGAALATAQPTSLREENAQ